MIRQSQTKSVWFGKSKTSDPKLLHIRRPDLLQTTTHVATFKAGDKRKTTNQHLFLPKDYSGSPTISIYTEWSEAEVYDHLSFGCGSGTISDLTLEYLHGPEAESLGGLDPLRVRFIYISIAHWPFKDHNDGYISPKISPKCCTGLLAELWQISIIITP